MALSADQFAKAVINAGLSSADEIKTLWSSLPAGTRPKDGETFAKVLVEREKLTQFQASELLSGSATPLVLGDYVLLAKIGAGGMGQVFKAQHRHMKRLVAIKLLPQAMTKDPEAVKRFQREVEAAAKLSHSNIVQAHDASVLRGVWYLVMEYVEGRDLSGVVADEGPLPVERAVDYIRQAAKGLAFAHKSGVVHRDIKPANLLLDKEGTVKILDMGLARFEDAAVAAAKDGLTQTGQVMGTIDYMAPEQAFDTHAADARADIYSLGCTLYRLLTGANLFEGDTLVKKLMAHQQQPAPVLTQKRADVSRELNDIFQKMVAKKPADRYQTMAEVEAALAALLSGGAASSPAITTDAGSKFSTFIRTITGQGKQPQPAAAGMATLARPDAVTSPASGNAPTMALANPLQVTDPVSERSVQIAREQTPQPASVKRPPLWRRTLVLAAGGLGGALLVLLGIWVIIRDKDGKEVGRIKVPDSGKAEIVEENVPGQTPPSAAPGKLFMHDPAFPQWMKDVEAMPAEEQVEAVSKKLMELNPGFDGNVTGHLGKGTPLIENGVVTQFGFDNEHGTRNVTDISPLRALGGLKWLWCGLAPGQLSDLSPLRGMNLENLVCPYTKISDLSPLTGMKLEVLDCAETQVSNLSPLKGMPLGLLWIPGTPVSDLSILQGMLTLKNVVIRNTQVTDLRPLQGLSFYSFYCDGAPVSDLSILRGMPLKYIYCDFKPERDHELLHSFESLETINGKPAAEFWKEVEEQQKQKKPLFFQTPGFDPWAKEVAAMPAEEQVEAVSKKLVELNPGFDGKEEHKIEDDAVTELRFKSDNVADISPVRALVRLSGLACASVILPSGKLADLSPLKGMQLAILTCHGNRIHDLSPLAGMKLVELNCADNPFADLSPLKGMPLRSLNIGGSYVSELSLLKEMPLNVLSFNSTKVTDLSPLQGMALTRLFFQGNAIVDLSPLEGMPLETLNCGKTPVFDLSPLKGMPLTSLYCFDTPIADPSLLHEFKNLTTLNLSRTKVLASGVTALQKALPNCKIEWDDPANPP